MVRKRGRRAQRKTPIEALQAARAELVRQKREAQQQQTLENHLRNHLMQVMRGLTEARAQALRDQDALRDEIDVLRAARDAEKQRAEEASKQAEAVATQAQTAEVAALTKRLQDEEATHTTQREHDSAAYNAKIATLSAEKDALQKTNDEAQGKLTELQAQAMRVMSAEHERQKKESAEAEERNRVAAREAVRTASERQALLRERDQIKQERDALVAQNERTERNHEEAVRSHDALRGQLDEVQRQLALRDEDLKQHSQRFTAVERAHQEVHIVAESESRSLRAEKERRIAAEQRVEQLTLDLERLEGESQIALDLAAPLAHALRDDRLTAELAEVRRHRDDAIAERELLAARILKLMAPGQYLEHAAAAGYDLTRDPLIRLKREEVLVESRMAAWQEAHGKRRRARRMDPEQTLDEQAYAAALSFRWKQIDHPHLRRKNAPKWVAVGFLLDAESERYLLTLTEERIAGMQRKMGAVG